jgi:hypothetical protein
MENGLTKLINQLDEFGIVYFSLNERGTERLKTWLKNNNTGKCDTSGLSIEDMRIAASGLYTVILYEFLEIFDKKKWNFCDNPSVNLYNLMSKEREYNYFLYFMSGLVLEKFKEFLSKEIISSGIDGHYKEFAQRGAVKMVVLFKDGDKVFYVLWNYRPLPLPQIQAQG